jgi:hypothetical protein
MRPGIARPTTMLVRTPTAALALDPATGELHLDGEGRVVPLAPGLRVEWEDVEYLIREEKTE